MTWTLGELGKRVNGSIQGDPDCVITSVSTLKNAQPQQITFLTNPAYKPYLATTQASAVIVNNDAKHDGNTNYLVVDNPHACYAKIAQLLHPAESVPASIHETASVASSSQIASSVAIANNVVIDDHVTIGENVVIGANTYIGKHCKIGRDTIIYSNVSIYPDVVVGERSIIHAGAVIGSDGFGQAFDGERWLKVPQLGGVRIGNEVEIGANTSIDRGAIDNTIIEDGVKLDNQIQIAHNVRLGAHTVIAACTGIAGSAHIGKHCMIGGFVAIAGHITIADGVAITATSLISKSISQAGTYSSSIPVEPVRVWRRYVARFKQLDAFAKRLKKLEKLLSVNKD